MQPAAHLLQERIEIRCPKLRIPAECVVQGRINAVHPVAGYDPPREHRRRVVEDDEVDFAPDARGGEVPPELQLCLEPGGVVGVATPIEEHADVHVALAVRAALGDAAEHIRRYHAGNRRAVQDAPQAGTRIGFG